MKKLFYICFILISINVNSQPTLWGMTTSSIGCSGLGSIFSTPTGSNGVSYQYCFERNIDGVTPSGGLVNAPNGKLYGLTTNGGTYSKGNIFEYDPVLNKYKKLFDFGSPGNQGTNPIDGLLLATNGKFYGVTQSGGAGFGFGVIYEYDYLNNIYTELFDSLNLSGPLIQASDGVLYGLAEYGGANNRGYIYSYNISLGKFTKIYQCNNWTDPIGVNPIGKLTEGVLGKLYGCTFGGGGTSNPFGCLFELDLNTKAITPKVYNNDYVGGYILKANNSKLYFGSSTFIFEYDIVTNTLVNKVNLSTLPTNNVHGDMIEHSNGILIGASGTSFSGYTVIFEYNYISNTLVTKYIFNDFYKGKSPNGSLTLAPNGKLYGLTYEGGGGHGGVLYEYDYTSNLYNKKIEFNYASNGAKPLGSLLKATNGKYYGLTQQGGAYNYGVLFEFDPNSQLFSKKHDFDSISGRNPTGSLIQLTNGKLYGTTDYGGINDDGVIFEFDLTSNVLTKKIDFKAYQVGELPLGKLFEASNGKLYGMANSGGLAGLGCLYEYDIILDTIVNRKSFTSYDSKPNGSFIEPVPGKLFGIANGTVSGYPLYSYYPGSIFEFDINNNTFTYKYQFSISSPTLGTYPKGSLIKASNGKLYGMTAFGGDMSIGSGSGVIFEYDLSLNNYTKKAQFDFLNHGGNPSGSLLEASNGKFYGFTNNSIFEYDLLSNAINKKLSLIGGEDLIEDCLRPPIPVLTSTNSLGMCSGGTISISAYSNINTSSYIWNLPSGATILSGNNTNNILSDFTGLPNGTYTMSVVGVNVCDTSLSNDFNIIIGIPSVNVNSTSTLICTGDTVIISATGANSYTWSTGSVSSSIIVTPSITTSYSVVGEFQGGCNDTAYFTQSVSQCVGIKENFISNSNYLIYPNPSQGLVEIDSRNGSEFFDVKIINSLGEIIVDRKNVINKISISLANESDGVYYLLISDKSGRRFNTKIIKQ